MTGVNPKADTDYVGRPNITYIYKTYSCGIVWDRLTPMSGVGLHCGLSFTE